MAAAGLDQLKLSAQDQQVLKSWLADFERCWHENLLAARVRELPPPGSPLRLLALVEMVKIDLKRQRQNGRHVKMEAYLKIYPELAEEQKDASQPSHSTLGTAKVDLPTQSFPLSVSAQGKLPEQFGRYRIIKRLGGGGMGTVYQAYDQQLDRIVALKTPHFSADDDPQNLERFYREARAAAGIRHSHLCPVYDVGQLEGIHYLTMAFIEGQSLAELASPAKLLPQKQVAALIRLIALAMAEAHVHGIIHRDLKPSNIMIAQNGEPVIMDFGLARPVSSDDTGLTRSGQILGTPAYMAPEQVAGDKGAIGPGCDIYSLGVILYELLTGRLPFQGSTGKVMAQVLMQEAPPPSSHRPDVDPQLEAICLKAMAKNRPDRYATMHDMAAALTDYLKTLDQPTAPHTQVYVQERVLVPLKRKRSPVLLWSAIAVGVIALLGLCVSLLPRAPTQGTVSIDLQGKRDGVSAQIDGRVIDLADLNEPLRLAPGKHHLLVTGDEIETVSRSFDLEPGDDSSLRVTLVRRVASPAEVKTQESAPPAVAKDTPAPKEKQTVSTTDSLRSSAPSAVQVQEKTAENAGGRRDAGSKVESPVKENRVGELMRLKGHKDVVWSVALSPDGNQALSGSEDKTVRLWDLKTKMEVKRFEGHAGAVFCVAFSTDGRRALSGSDDRTVRVWDVAGGTELTRFDGHKETVTTLAVSPDGQFALSGGADKKVRLWNIANGQEIRAFEGHTDWVRGVAFAPDGRRALSCGDDRTIRLWDVDTSRELHRFEGHSAWVTSVTFAPNGRQFVSGSGDNTVRFWEVETRREWKRFGGHEGAVFSVAFSADGRRVVSAGGDKIIRVWDVETGNELQRLEGHSGSVYSVSLSKDGRMALSGSGDKTVRLWGLK